MAEGPRSSPPWLNGEEAEDPTEPWVFHPEAEKTTGSRGARGQFLAPSLRLTRIPLGLLEGVQFLVGLWVGILFGCWWWNVSCEL